MHWSNSMRWLRNLRPANIIEIGSGFSTQVALEAVAKNGMGNIACIEPYPRDWNLLGGRSLSARILNTECDPTCDPLGPDNVLVLAPGVISWVASRDSTRMLTGS